MARTLKVIKRNGLNMLVFAYFSMWGFALFNYKSNSIFTMPDTLLRMSQIDRSDFGKCRVNFNDLGEDRMRVRFTTHKL